MYQGSSRSIIGLNGGLEFADGIFILTGGDIRLAEINACRSVFWFRFQTALHFGDRFVITPSVIQNVPFIADQPYPQRVECLRQMDLPQGFIESSQLRQVFCINGVGGREIWIQFNSSPKLCFGTGPIKVVSLYSRNNVMRIGERCVECEGLFRRCRFLRISFRGLSEPISVKTA